MFWFSCKTWRPNEREKEEDSDKDEDEEGKEEQHRGETEAEERILLERKGRRTNRWVKEKMKEKRPRREESRTSRRRVGELIMKK